VGFRPHTRISRRECSETQRKLSVVYRKRPSRPMGIEFNVATSGCPRSVNSYGVRYVPFLVKVGFETSTAILVPGPHERIVGDDLQNAADLAVHSSQPFHRHDVIGRRAGNERVAGSGVEREVIKWAGQEIEKVFDQHTSRTVPALVLVWGVGIYSVGFAIVLDAH
jgi:hypothetical protein